ncbi:MAG TPA: biotin--[acetyl-CoA-carboxylase] ligase [Candidatus Brocadiaceae bacterium]
MHIVDLLNVEEIKDGLKTKWLGQKIYFYEEVDSTNEVAKREAYKGTDDGSLFVTEQQSCGKGRLGRGWITFPGAGVWMSLLLKPDMLPNKISQITLIGGFVVCKAIRGYTGLDAYIKWPNDIVINGKKICGILTEMSTDTEKINYIIHGIGINVNIDFFPEEIAHIATSLYIEGGKNYSRKALLQEILCHFEAYYEQFLKYGSLENIISEYEQLCINIGKEIQAISGNHILYGKAVGITDSGELLIQKETGEVIKLNSGEVSLRGLSL